MLKVVVVGLGRFGSTVALANWPAAEPRSWRWTAVPPGRGGGRRRGGGRGLRRHRSANLEAYDVGSMDAAVVAIGSNFESSVLVTMHLKALGVPTVYAKALNEMQEAVLRRVGADHVVKPEEDMGQRLADHLIHDSVVDFVELPEGISLRRVAIPDDWAGQSLADLDLLGRRRLNLVQVLPDRGTADERRGTVQHSRCRTAARSCRPGDQVDVIGPGRRIGRSWGMDCRKKLELYGVCGYSLRHCVGSHREAAAQEIDSVCLAVRGFSRLGRLQPIKGVIR